MSDRAEDNLNYRSNKEAKKVGKFTGNYTQTGRKIYETDSGELVSEKSTTIKLDTGFWVNAPTIYNGKKYSEDGVRSMLLNKKIKPTSIHKSQVEARKAAKKRSSLLKAVEARKKDN